MLISTICIYMIKMAVFSTTCGEIKMPAVRWAGEQRKRVALKYSRNCETELDFITIRLYYVTDINIPAVPTELKQSYKESVTVHCQSNENVFLCNIKVSSLSTEEHEKCCLHNFALIYSSNSRHCTHWTLNWPLCCAGKENIPVCFPIPGYVLFRPFLISSLASRRRSTTSRYFSFRSRSSEVSSSCVSWKDSWQFYEMWKRSMFISRIPLLSSHHWRVRSEQRERLQNTSQAGLWFVWSPVCTNPVKWSQTAGFILLYCS